MQVAIAGGHGKIALELTRLLSNRGDSVRSLIRNPDHAGDIRAAGGEPLICDLEHSDVAEVAEAIGSADAVVFAAGAGPGSGSERKDSMDYRGAVKTIEAALRNGISRYLMVSAMSADADHAGTGTFDAYIRAKGQADQALAESGLDYTIVRPGLLTDEPARGRVRASEHAERGEIPRADVAAVLIAALDQPSSIHRTFKLIAGDDPIADAVAGL